MTPAANTEAMNLEVPANISLLSLAPFSPELNPTETVWDCLRQNKLCSAVWDSYDDILEVCIIAWKIQIAFDPTAPATGRVSMLKRTGISARILCVAHATRSGHRRILRVYKVGNPRSLQDGRLVVMTWRMRPNIGARKFKSARPRYTNKGKTARRCVAIAEIKA